MIVAALMCTLLVTNTNDDGHGSLRAAIEDANARGLAGCAIHFDIPGDGAWKTIRPQRPLPPLVFGTIDGETPPDTNPDGPDIELHGAELSEGSGLQVCSGTIRGLAINGFPANGISISGGQAPCPFFPRGGKIERNYIGTDPTGTRAIPNTRGIWIDDPRWHHTIAFMWTVEKNVVSGNRYSGVFVARGPQLVRENVIGLTPKLDAGLGNGSSGVAVLQEGSGTDIDDNYIGFNHHFGVGLAPGTASVAMYGNSFQANGQLAIDHGFDGASPDGKHDSYTGVPAVPVITHVRYENGETIIEGTSPRCLGSNAWINVYGNDAPDPSGYGEGQYWLAAVRAGSTFILRHRGDLRGKWVAATFTCGFYYGFPLRTNSDVQAVSITTSEFSRSVLVP